MMQATHTNRLTVLLAEEKESWPNTVRQLLEPQGVQTLSVRTGREALELIQQKAAHVVVLNEQMPQLGGLQVIRMMREMPDAPPAILLANQLTSHLLTEALGMQVFSVLGRPVDLNVLLDALARAMKRYYLDRWPGN